MTDQILPNPTAVNVTRLLHGEIGDGPSVTRLLHGDIEGRQDLRGKPAGRPPRN